MNSTQRKNPKSKAACALAAALSCLTTHAIAAEQDRVALEDGSVLYGYVEGVEADFLRLSVSMERDAGIRRIDRSHIQALSLWDADAFESLLAKQASESSPDPDSLRSYVFRRVAIIGLLSEPEESNLLEYLELLARDGGALESLAYAKLWHPKLKYSRNVDKNRLLLISLSLQAELPQEALVHAEACIAADPDEAAPLAWHVIANSYLESGKAEKALWSSLTPIARSQTPPEVHLDKCYETAIEACYLLGNQSYAESLEDEYASRFDQSPPVNFVINESPEPLSLFIEQLTFDDLRKTNSIEDPKLK